ncbi:acyltransferase family protein [Nocardioides pocheonensis]|uniref:Acyltransferase n=1 Tax=Nocardioides pocheonensis TaxID=661485 RepID=A0A3N0GMX4_9ACTN|nr:acyltransferase family protein [Nocardioides pocheonensis]RNM13804.1 acyltransferase [Nocardioides pocheonensis]
MTLTTPGVRRRLPPPAEQRSDGLRFDIQALRAVAVGAVLVFHFWPHLLRGGFVGVDVFFVISGFLITSHMLKHPPARAGDFAAFWARRVLRLIPAVGVVLLPTLLLVVLYVPTAQWHELAREAATSMLYVQNWQLITQATDYLDAHHAPSPFQHFWSLSVEEQYYIAWPFVVAGLTWAVRRLGRKRLVAAGFLLVLAVSFGLSVTQTSSSPAHAYFSTWTRMWELAIGSLLAAVYPGLSQSLTARFRQILWWCGALGIALSCVVITSSTPFPGYAAALPTVSTALVILAGDPRGLGAVRRFTHAAPVQLVGDISYALYLWHWPLIVIAPYALGRDLGFLDTLVVLACALTAAWASTRFVEAPVRSSSFLRGRSRRALLAGLAISTTVVLAATALSLYVSGQVRADAARVRTALTSDRPCFGAGAMDPKHHCPDPHGDQLFTSPAFAKADFTEGIDKCLNWPPYKYPAISCARGDTTRPSGKIALFGNSHAGQWTEAISRIAEAHQWRLDTYIVGACFSSIKPQSADCTKITSEVIDRIRNGGYRLVVFATFDGHNSGPDLYRSTIDAFTAAGAHVLVIRDTPAPWDENNPPADCVSRHLHRVAACDGKASVWIRPDPLHLAASTLARTDRRVTTVDLNRFLCVDGRCPSVIGGVIVFSDFNHLSKTFSTTLAPYLEPAVIKGMRKGS